MFSGKGKRKENERIIEEILCSRYNEYYRMVLGILGNEEDASDAVQEGAYRAIKSAGSLKNEEYASTWIYRIVINEAYRILAKRKDVPVDEIPDREVHMDVYEDFDLKEALNEMAPKDRLIIQMKYFEDMKLEEIADILGENISTVKSRLYRSLKKLRMTIEEGKDDE